jgi:hypothetical protein
MLDGQQIDDASARDDGDTVTGCSRKESPGRARRAPSPHRITHGNRHDPARGIRFKIEHRGWALLT